MILQWLNTWHEMAIPFFFYNQLRRCDDMFSGELCYYFADKPKQYFSVWFYEPSAAFSLSICYTSNFYATLSHFTQIMSSQVQYCHPQLLIYTLCSQCEIISVNASSPLQPCLYHRPQLVALALWSHHSNYNGTSAAPSWDFTHTHTQIHIRLLCFSGPSPSRWLHNS